MSRIQIQAIPRRFLLMRNTAGTGDIILNNILLSKAHIVGLLMEWEWPVVVKTTFSTDLTLKM